MPKLLQKVDNQSNWQQSQQFYLMRYFICLLLIALTTARQYPLFNQCDVKWANEKLGNSTNTICKGGDLISSVAMGLAAIGVNQNPSSLNTWLKSHKGYDSKNSFVWASINSLGAVYQGQFSNALLKLNLDVGYLVIINVNKGAHWVLATGYTENTIHVMDSQHPEIKNYDISVVVSGHNAVYKVPNTKMFLGIANKYEEILRVRGNRKMPNLVKYE